MTGRVRVRPAGGTALPGDEPQVVEPDASRPQDVVGRAVLGRTRRDSSGELVVEVVVDGWRFELAVEDADRAELRERATRASDEVARSGPTEILAIIPGRIVTVRVAPGDAVEGGQSLMVVEAMKMQNELRAPRAGTVRRIEVVGGQTIEVGDLLAVIE